MLTYWLSDIAVKLCQWWLTAVGDILTYLLNDLAAKLCQWWLTVVGDMLTYWLSDTAVTYSGRWHAVGVNQHLNCALKLQCLTKFWTQHISGTFINSFIPHSTNYHCTHTVSHTCHPVPFDSRWLGGLLVERRTSVSDTWFDSRPGRCRVKTLGKFLTPSCNVVLYNII